MEVTEVENVSLGTSALCRLLEVEWDENHPPTCNCERCDWRLTQVFRNALRRFGIGGAK